MSGHSHRIRRAEHSPRVASSPPPQPAFDDTFPAYPAFPDTEEGNKTKKSFEGLKNKDDLLQFFTQRGWSVDLNESNRISFVFNNKQSSLPRVTYHLSEKDQQWTLLMPIGQNDYSANSLQPVEFKKVYVVSDDKEKTGSVVTRNLKGCGAEGAFVETVIQEARNKTRIEKQELRLLNSGKNSSSFQVCDVALDVRLPMGVANTLLADSLIRAPRDLLAGQHGPIDVTLSAKFLFGGERVRLGIGGRGFNSLNAPEASGGGAFFEVAFTNDFALPKVGKFDFDLLGPSEQGVRLAITGINGPKSYLGTIVSADFFTKQELLRTHLGPFSTSLAFVNSSVIPIYDGGTVAPDSYYPSLFGQVMEPGPIDLFTVRTRLTLKPEIGEGGAVDPFSDAPLTQREIFHDLRSTAFTTAVNITHGMMTVRFQNMANGATPGLFSTLLGVNSLRQFIRGAIDGQTLFTTGQLLRRGTWLQRAELGGATAAIKILPPAIMAPFASPWPVEKGATGNWGLTEEYLSAGRTEAARGAIETGMIVGSALTGDIDSKWLYWVPTVVLPITGILTFVTIGGVAGNVNNPGTLGNLSANQDPSIKGTADYQSVQERITIGEGFAGSAIGLGVSRASAGLGYYSRRVKETVQANPIGPFRKGLYSFLPDDMSGTLSLEPLNRIASGGLPVSGRVNLVWNF